MWRRMDVIIWISTKSIRREDKKICRSFFNSIQKENFTVRKSWKLILIIRFYIRAEVGFVYSLQLF